MPWKQMLLVLWLLSQTLGFALPGLSSVAERQVPFWVAQDQRLPANNGYDAGSASCEAYDAELLSLTMEGLSDPVVIVRTTPAYDFAPVATTRIAGCPRAPPVTVAGFLAAKRIAYVTEVTEKALACVEGHLNGVLRNQFPQFSQAEQLGFHGGEMAKLGCLRSGATTSHDIEFYLHELKEGNWVRGGSGRARWQVDFISSSRGPRLAYRIFSRTRNAWIAEENEETAELPGHDPISWVMQQRGGSAAIQAPRSSKFRQVNEHSPWPPTPGIST